MVWKVIRVAPSPRPRAWGRNRGRKRVPMLKLDFVFVLSLPSLGAADEAKDWMLLFVNVVVDITPS